MGINEVSQISLSCGASAPTPPPPRRRRRRRRRPSLPAPPPPQTLASCTKISLFPENPLLLLDWHVVVSLSPMFPSRGCCCSTGDGQPLQMAELLCRCWKLQALQPLPLYSWAVCRVLLLVCQAQQRPPCTLMASQGSLIAVIFQGTQPECQS